MPPISDDAPNHRSHCIKALHVMAAGALLMLKHWTNVQMPVPPPLTVKAADSQCPPRPCHLKEAYLLVSDGHSSKGAIPSSIFIL